MRDLTISNFDDLLFAARQQPESQRLLFVFANAELPEDSTDEQRRRFAAGAGGALIPMLCVDKTPDEMGPFSGLVEESRALGSEWTIVFVAKSCGARRPSADP